jgi:hypothetical protein
MFCSIPVFSQNGRTFIIEELPRPEKPLFQKGHEDILKNLILDKANLSLWEINNNEIEFDYGIIAASGTPDSLVDFGYNSFFYGMYQAYAEHRPFVLSPDMIWLLITQGFARHIHANAESLREYFVDHSGKHTLIVESGTDLMTNPDEWEKIFPQFTTQISEYVGDELVNHLTADFSTTTSVEKIATEITIMEAMEPYFEYIVIRMVCGIPEITLQGTTEDWQKILDKIKYLERYQLQWWIKELEPILKEFVDASNGNINKKFWKNMFKYHSQKEYGAPNIIDGWIVKFFPYDKDGKRNNLKNLTGGKTLPDEIVKVDLKYIEINGGYTKETMLELWSGFIGLEQNPKNFALTPRIGWMIKKKDAHEQGIIQKLQLENQPCSSWGNGISIRIDEVPASLGRLNEIYSLDLHFTKAVSIPDWLKDVRIGILKIEGNITRAETDKIIRLFPDTDITINGKNYHKGNNGWILISGNQIPREVLKSEHIWILEIRNISSEKEVLTILNDVKHINIQILSLESNMSLRNIQKIKQLLPETKIYMQGKEIKN